MTPWFDVRPFEEPRPSGLIEDGWASGLNRTGAYLHVPSLPDRSGSDKNPDMIRPVGLGGGLNVCGRDSITGRAVYFVTTLTSKLARRW